MSNLNPVPQSQTKASGAAEATFSVGLIILNYNTGQNVIALYQQIAALRAGYANPPFFLVVDNASQPEDTALLATFFAGRPDAELILNKSNNGYACGNNLGLRRAAELGLEYCMIANSDIAFLTADFLERLIEATRTLPDCGLIGPRVVLSNGNTQGPLPESGIINSVIPLPVARCERTEAVYATVGCCLFGSTKVFVRIGLLDETTFLYREENILAERLLSHGLLWYYLPTVIVRHDHIRKMESISKILLHKKFEAQSTIYYFRHYKKRSMLAILAYRLLLAAKVIAFILITSGLQAKRLLVRKAIN